jgi:cytochrome d ubiquinol oxidase subunit I
MSLAAFVSTAFAVAGVHAFRLLRNPASAFHQRALGIALAFGAVTALLQPLSGDLSAKDVARRQPAKLAAMEAHYHTERGAPLLLGGLPDDATQSVRYGVEIPYALSVLAHGDPDAEVIGLDAFAPEDRPPTRVVHLAFQVMVGAGSALALLALVFLFLRWRRPSALLAPWFLRCVVASTPLGFLAVEAGWTVTEVGRQPWIIYGVMRTRDAVSPMPGLIWPLLGSVFVYAVLCLVVVFVLGRLIRRAEQALSLEGAHV